MFITKSRTRRIISSGFPNQIHKQGFKNTWKFYRKDFFLRRNACVRFSLYDMISYKYIFLYLKQSHRGEEICRWFATQMVAQARIRPGQCRNLFCVSHMGSTDTQALGPFSTAFPGPLAECWMGNGAAGTQSSTKMGCWYCWGWLCSLCPSTGPCVYLIDSQ